MTDQGFALTLSCHNQPGIVASVSTAIHQAGGDIFNAQQFDDALEEQFYMRVLFRLADGGKRLAEFEENFAKVAETLNIKWRLRDRNKLQRVVIMASKFDHCLADLLYRWRIGEQPMDIVSIISNHPRETYEGHDFADIPFHHLPVSKANKPEQEAQIWNIVQETEADLVILARYMQILSDDLAAKLSGQCINIHHSFLPSFKGAKPYHQAHARGVKVIGATAHYVTADLDEGPIIEQDVERVTHIDSPNDMIRRGRDIERRVLARAVRYHLDDRVMLRGNKTVVFDT